MTRRVGMIARAEDRGLGNMLWDFYDHMSPDATLLVVPVHDLPVHRERFPDAIETGWDGTEFTNPARVKAFLECIDVLYTAETFYDWRIVKWARERGVRTVCHAMPEFWRTGPGMAWEHKPMPDQVWNPTGYRHHTLPPGSIIVPVPVRGVALTAADPVEGPLRVLHVGGAAATADRNGTQLAELVAELLQGQDVVVTIQQQTHETTEPDRWSIYSGHHLLLMPRRYAGLSLPVHEASASGLAVAMTDCPPNTTEWWNALPMHASKGRPVSFAGGHTVDTYVTDPHRAARDIVGLAHHRNAVAALQAASRYWAEERGWSVWRPLYRQMLEAV